ncbi:glycoside hydrolase family 1 protein [Candidatus Saccharibacteria bacterium]|jgi:beta-glucosidase|nr:glycoside hydrolase family 1 protein [Candidatus Saccharibacteria bacterium]
MQNNPKFNFPKSFLWGAATSAHQVEGGNHNQWTVWEQESARSLATQAAHKFDDLPGWSRNKRLASTPANYVSARAVDHYRRYKEDFDLLEKMNMNSFRFSVEWSRVEPEEGVWNAAELAHYKSYVTELRKRGIEPILTLFHFTLPVWFAKKGGFLKRKNVDYFVRFAEKVMSELGSSVRFVITINEPTVYAGESFKQGVWPPNLQSTRLLLKVLRNLAYAHKKATKTIKSVQSRAKVSIAHNSTYVYAGDDAVLSRISASVTQWALDDYFLRKVYKSCDFLGINYYFSSRIYGYRIHNPNRQLSDLGWDLAPENIEYALVRLWDKYKLPIMITENGIADEMDEMRKPWLVKTIAGIHNAMKSDVKVIGYMHWSLLDNFEWAYGRWPRFGLAAVDYRTQKRTLRPSAIWFGKAIKHIRKK